MVEYELVGSEGGECPDQAEGVELYGGRGDSAERISSNGAGYNNLQSEERAYCATIHHI